MTATKAAASKLRDWFSTYRVLFGCLVAFSAFRFWKHNWIDDLYIKPTFHFTFPGLTFIKVLPGNWMYLAFFVLAVCGILIAMAGSVFTFSGVARSNTVNNPNQVNAVRLRTTFKKLYRPACIVFFIVFTYIELIDVTYYLNHYYLVSSLSFLMIFYNIDESHSSIYNQRVIFFLKLQVSIVYFFGGINKIGLDWLLNAQPLKIWLSAKSELPLIGSLMRLPATAFIIAWLSMIFDLSVAFLLWFKRTRLPAYIILSVFHLLTAMLFNIGMFPWIMMCAALLFFNNSAKQLTVPGSLKDVTNGSTTTKARSNIALAILTVFTIFQLIFPVRHIAYPGNYLITERGFRFAWNIMLIEKNGIIEFGVRLKNGNIEDVKESDHLTPFQQKMLATQPDLILQFAEYIKQQYQNNGKKVTAVFAENYVSLNGRPSTLFFDPSINLISGEHELYKSIGAYAADHK